MVAKTDRGKHCEREIVTWYLKIKEKYGDVFPHIGKERIYSEIADETEYSTHRIAIVIRDYIRGRIAIG